MHTVTGAMIVSCALVCIILLAQETQHEAAQLQMSRSGSARGLITAVSGQPAAEGEDMAQGESFSGYCRARGRPRGRGRSVLLWAGTLSSARSQHQRQGLLFLTEMLTWSSTSARMCGRASLVCFVFLALLAEAKRLHSSRSAQSSP